MKTDLVALITARDPSRRDQSLAEACRGLNAAQLEEQAGRLDAFRRTHENLYERVRALFFLYALYRFHLPAASPPASGGGRLPYSAYQQLLARRFEEAIETLRAAQRAQGFSDLVASGLAAAYKLLAFQTLAAQVRRSVRGVAGNQWMFRMGHPANHPLQLRPELRQPSPEGGFPLLREATPVRMDLSHSAWSDIFFLGMDYPEGARVLNVSIDLGVRGRDRAPRPPVQAYLRVLDEPVLRLTSIDLGCTADLTRLEEVFDFARDYLGLLKAALLASGLVPPGLESSSQPLTAVIEKLVGPGRGLELISQVNDIPKGSRLAVSTNLLAGLIAVCMRATGQTASLTGPLREDERRLVAARAILGEWLAGSGGGWQDSGGIWPGIKLIRGEVAGPGDPEHGISRGCLLPRHEVLGLDDISAAARERLQASLVLVHGGLAQNVGPILEMVTEKYLLRSPLEWAARGVAGALFDEILGALRAGDIAALGAATTRNFEGPIQAIIPWASTEYTERLIEAARSGLGADFQGFWMLGGMSGGGMGFMVRPAARSRAQDFLADTMLGLKRELEAALPFAMDPVVYDFAINAHGSVASLERGPAACLPPTYHALMAPRWLRLDPRQLTPARRAELQAVDAASRTDPAFRDLAPLLFQRLLPGGGAAENQGASLPAVLAELGFDREQHEAIRTALRAGRLGLAQNRLPVNTVIEDVQPEDVIECRTPPPPEITARGSEALRAGRVAVVTLAAGSGSRWTRGAGVVKALNPFCKFAGRHRSFVEVHLAKSRARGAAAGCYPTHIFTTSYLTHAPIAASLERAAQYGYPGRVTLSPGQAIGLRMIPMVRDLRFLWEETAQQQLEPQAQKARAQAQAALLHWAQAAGEGGDYTDNLPLQCLQPIGHWFEAANLLRNGVLAGLLADQPHIEHLLLHNIDTVGADLDPAFLGRHLAGEATFSFEVIPRRVEDLGGGLARADGRVRLIEGLALPSEELEFELSYYNTMTTWIHLDRFLGLFGLDRAALGDTARVARAVRNLAARIPTYITIKDVKKRWGHGQEDVFPISQYEKLWSDMTGLPEARCQFLVASRARGQQLKDPAQLDGWLRDGGADHVESHCLFTSQACHHDGGR